MSDQPPKGPGFNTAPGGPADPPAGPNTIAHKSEEERLAKLRAGHALTTRTVVFVVYHATSRSP